VKERITDLNVDETAALSESEVIFEWDRECDHPMCKTESCEIAYDSDVLFPNSKQDIRYKTSLSKANSDSDELESVLSSVVMASASDLVTHKR